jgi:hypothetical protein
MESDTSWVLAPGTTKLDPRRIRYTYNLLLYLGTLGAKQHLGSRLSALTKASQNHLKPVNVVEQHLLFDDLQNVLHELVRRIVMLALALLEAKIAARHGDDGVAVGPGEGDVGIVAVRKYVQVERFAVLVSGQERLFVRVAGKPACVGTDGGLEQRRHARDARGHPSEVGHRG